MSHVSASLFIGIEDEPVNQDYDFEDIIDVGAFFAESQSSEDLEMRRVRFFLYPYNVGIKIEYRKITARKVPMRTESIITLYHDSPPELKPICQALIGLLELVIIFPLFIFICSCFSEK